MRVWSSNGLYIGKAQSIIDTKMKIPLAYMYFDSTSGKTGGLTQLISNLIINIHITVMMATVIKLKIFTL